MKLKSILVTTVPLALIFTSCLKTHNSKDVINDNGTIVGYYSKTASATGFRHGFIYSNGQWAKLDFPNSNLETQLTGISDANLIIGTTIRSSFETGSFLYKNGTFKKIIVPNSNVPTYAEAVSPGKNLITGFSGYKGFIATCK